MKLPAFAVLLCASLNLAQAQTFTATMNGAQDGGGARQGSGFVTLTLSGNSLSLSGTFSGITTNMSAGHIHGPGAIGQNVGVLYDLIALGILTGTTSGTYNGTVNLVANPNNTPNYSVAQQLTDLNAGLWYLNIHDSVFPGGEIRGQILPIPEPAVLPMLTLGAAALLYIQRRRR